MLFNVNVIWKFSRKRSKRINHLPTREKETNVMQSWADLSVKFKTRFRDWLPSCCSWRFNSFTNNSRQRSDDFPDNIYDICRMVRNRVFSSATTAKKNVRFKKELFLQFSRKLWWQFFFPKALTVKVSCVKKLKASWSKSAECRDRTWLNIQISPEKISGKKDKKCIRPLRTINDAF